MFHEGNGKVCTRVGQGLGTALAVPQEESGEMAGNRIAQGTPHGAFRAGPSRNSVLGQGDA